MVFGITPPPPAFSPAPGTYVGMQLIALSSTVPGASIYYTIDGSTPTFPVTGTTQQYTGPISVNSSETIKAVAVGRGFAVSLISTGVYVIDTLSYQSATLPGYTPGVFYSQPTIQFVSNGVPPLTFTFVSSTGPDTWSVSTGGVISGTPGSPTAQSYVTSTGVPYVTGSGTQYVT